MALRRLVGVPATAPAPGAFGTLERPRLIERLGNALALRVACIVAPAGYGKSTLVRQYLDALSGPAAVVRVPTGGGLLPLAREVAQAVHEIAPG
ncbi:MAG: hypothetical protein KGM44_12330, partial [bacterium]|nr:hypothetical protein [bacterium]